MSKYITGISSLIAVVVGYKYLHSEGLIISTDYGTYFYSNALQSSGGNDGFLVSLGFMSFVFSFMFSLAAQLKKVSNQKVKFLYLINFSFFLFIIFLVNLDVSIARSIALGDYLLFFGFIVVILPIAMFVKTAIQQLAKH